MAGTFFRKLFKRSKRQEFVGYSSNEYGYSALPKARRLQFLLRHLRVSKTKIAILSVVVVAVVGFAFWFRAASNNIKSASEVAGAKSETVAPPYATKYINREFIFPIRNEKGNKVAEFKYDIIDAQLTKEIVVKGQKQATIAGRSLLIVNIKLKNDGKQKITVNTRDYVRLIINDNMNDLLAPGVYNDPVDVQAISSQPNRIGFAISDTDTNLKLQIGEIDGEKQIIEVQF